MTVVDLLRRELQTVSPRPSAIFLGSHEHEALATVAREFVFGRVASKVDVEGAEECRLEFHGLKVYRVDAKSYIGFGMAKESPCG